MNTPIYPCLGALVGDTVGSVYEFNNIKTTQFPLFSHYSSFTDDSVMTMAIADWLANTDRSEEQQIETMVKWEHNIPMLIMEEAFGIGCSTLKVCLILMATLSINELRITHGVTVPPCGAALADGLPTP